MSRYYKGIFASIIFCAALGAGLGYIVRSFYGAGTMTVSSLNVQRDIRVFTKDSALIVIGTVSTTGQPYWNSDHSMIQRDVLLNIEETLKGEKNTQNISITVYGGKVENQKILYESSPVFVPGEKVLVFLGKDWEGKYVPYAQSSGVYWYVNSQGMKDSEGKALEAEGIINEIREVLKNE